mgnify:CR=1 FL=1
MNTQEIFTKIDMVVAKTKVVIDRQKGSTNPRYDDNKYT